MNILLVDDDEPVRKSLEDFLVQLGHRVISCGDGVEALLGMERDRVHMVLSDIQMPSMDGHALLRAIRGNPSWNDTVVVLITGHGDIKSAVEAMRGGAYDYLLKPINIRELAIMTERIAEYLSLKEEHGRLSDNFEREVKKVTMDLQRELEDLRKAFAREVGVGNVGLFSESIREVFRTAARLHKNPDIPVLIEGETGTGKEVLARYIHYSGGETTTPFVALNCAAIPPNLLESELFGYEAGAFTGGKTRGQKGKLELARGGTLFLDEITELPVEYQAKLLRLIQERRYYQVGGLKEYIADVRFVCATNRDIRAAVDQGLFRADLYYRLNMGALRIPPLRERREEILPLAEMFISSLAGEKRTVMKSIGNSAADILERYDWPGNVRQLKNTVERIALLSDGEVMLPAHLAFLQADYATKTGMSSMPDTTDIRSGAVFRDGGFDLNAHILDTVRKALERNRWNKSKTAEFLKITRNELYTYLKHLEKTE